MAVSEQIHPVERERVAEAARIHLISEGISPQTLADNIIAHPRTVLRTLREGRPISRRAVSNLVAGKAVKLATVSAVKQYLCYRHQLPFHVFEVDPDVERVAEIETIKRLGRRPNINALIGSTGKCDLSVLKYRFDIGFEVEYSPVRRVLLARARAYSTDIN